MLGNKEYILMNVLFFIQLGEHRDEKSAGGYTEPPTDNHSSTDLYHVCYSLTTPDLRYTPSVYSPLTQIGGRATGTEEVE